MANEGSTKPTTDWRTLQRQTALAFHKLAEHNQYFERCEHPFCNPNATTSNFEEAGLVKKLAETSSELARVRGLLQRLIVYGSYHATCLACDKTSVVDAGLNAVHEPDCWLVKELSQGAESADIGKLDSAEEKDDV